MSAVPPTDTAFGRGLTLQQAGAAAGSFRWLELRTFEVLGGWVQSMPEPEAKLLLANHSYHHAWHADLWEERLPALAGVDREALTAAPSPGWQRVMELLAGSEQFSTIERLAAAYRVLLPRKIAAYRTHLAVTTAAADGPARRVLDLVVRDEVADWQEGEMLLQALLRTTDDAARAARLQAALESLLVIPTPEAGA